MPDPCLSNVYRPVVTMVGNIGQSLHYDTYVIVYFSWRDAHGVFLANVITNGALRGMSICETRVSVLFVYIGCRFSTRVPVQSLTTSNQRRHVLDRILSSSQTWRTPAKADTRAK